MAARQAAGARGGTTSFYNPLDPKLRALVGMGNRDNPEGVSTNHIGDVMRKNPKVDTTVTSTPQPGNFGMLQNPIHDCGNLVSKSDSQARLPGFIIGDRLAELFLRLFKNDLYHLPN
jgi:hypothetical protein